MRLTAIWYKEGREVYRVSPVMNIVCDDDMRDIDDIEVADYEDWYSTEMLGIEADDFIIITERN